MANYRDQNISSGRISVNGKEMMAWRSLDEHDRIEFPSSSEALRMVRDGYDPLARLRFNEDGSVSVIRHQ